MSLEAAIDRNTEALTKLLARLEHGPALAGVTPPTAEAPKAPARGKVSVKDGVATHTPPIEAPAQAPVAEAPATISYETIQSAVLGLAKTKGKEAAVGAIGKFENKDAPGTKATNAKQIRTEDYQKLLDAVKAAS